MLERFSEMFGIGPEDIRWLIKIANKYRYYPVTVPQRLQGMRRAMRASRSKLMTDYLLHEYPDTPFLRCNNATFPVAIFLPPSGPSLIQGKDEIIKLDKAWNPEVRVQSRSFYWLQRSQIEAENRDTFIMKEMGLGSRLCLTCGIADFFTGLCSSQALEWELHQVIGWAEERHSTSYSEIKKRLKLRKRMLTSVRDPITNGHGRAAPVAISVLLAYKQNGFVRLLLRRRGPLSIVYDQGKWHVFPSGMFQAPCKDYDTEFSLLHCVLWEFLEELFDVPDPPDRRAHTKWFYGYQPVSELRELLDRGAAQLWFTGIAINMASLRPEVLLTLYISDEGWARRHETGERGAHVFRFSKEIATAGEMKGVGPILQRPILLPSPDELFKQCGLGPDSMVPVGAAALYAGVLALDQILQR
jgi:hypothetical protein